MITQNLLLCLVICDVALSFHKIPKFPSYPMTSLKSSKLALYATSPTTRQPKIIIAGAPASGKGTQCEMIKKEFGVVHLSTGDILRAAVKEGTELGMKAKSFMDAGQLVPDELITGVIKDRLSQSDCKEQGWLLDGFPRTQKQAATLQSEGLIPDCFVLLDVPEEVLVERVTGRRTDPVTGKIYHMKYSPPESPEVSARLVQRSDDTAEKVGTRYREFQSHIDAVRANYEACSVWVDGTMSPQEVSFCVISGIKSYLDAKQLSQPTTAAPTHTQDDGPLKVMIAGAPASGKGTQCEVIKTEFGLVHLSTGDILRAAVKEGSDLGVQAKAFMDAGKLVPDELVIGVVRERLAQEDCRARGWLLDGFPRTAAQADALKAEGLVPDAFILLDVPEEVLVERVTGRRTDPVTGKIYHMKYSPPESPEVSARLVQRSDDTAEKVGTRYREFQSHIDAVRANYEACSVWVDGTMSPQEVSHCIVSVLKSVAARKSAGPDADGPKNGRKDDDDEDSDTVAGSGRESSVLAGGRAASTAGAESAKMVLGMAVLMVSDKLLSSLFLSKGWGFPSSLAGMVGLFAALCGTRRVSPSLADGASSLLSPAVALLKAWLPVFFVPPLVILPTKTKLVAGSEAAFALIIGGGFLLSLSACAALLSLMESFGIKEAQPTAEDLVKPYPTPALAPPGVPLAVAAVALLLQKTQLGDRGVSSRAFGVSSSLFAYIMGTKVPERIRKAFAHPVLVCAAITYSLLSLLSLITVEPINTILAAYFGSGGGGGDVISGMLGPAVISFGLQLYQYRGMLQRNALTMTATTVFSALFGLLSSALLTGIAFRISPKEAALAPLTRCITTPLALAGSRFTGADPSLSALFVVLTGILGASFGEQILGRFRVKTPVAVGLSLGASAHGLGAASVSYDPIKFSAALVSMTLTGLWTVSALAAGPLRNNLMRIATGGVLK